MLVINFSSMVSIHVVKVLQMGDGIFNKINNASHLHRSLCLFNFTTFS